MANHGPKILESLIILYWLKSLETYNFEPTNQISFEVLKFLTQRIRKHWVPV